MDLNTVKDGDLICLRQTVMHKYQKDKKGSIHAQSLTVHSVKLIRL